MIYLSNDIELNLGPASFFSFGHLNVRSINNIEIFDEISYLMSSNNFHIFALTETCRLNERISSDCFQIPGYNPRLDRIDRMGRCVALFTIDSLVVRQRIDLEIDGFGFCGLNFQLNNGNFFVVCAIGLLIMMLLHCLFFSKNFN